MFLPSLAGGGAERATIELAAALRGRGVDARLVLPVVKGGLEDLARELLPGSAIIDLESGRVRWSVPALASHLRRESPDVLLAAPDDTVFYAELARLLAMQPGTALVSVIHSTPTRQTRSLGRKGWLVARALRWVLPRADLVICVSEGARRDLVDRIDASLTPQVIPNPVDVYRVRRLSEEACHHPWLQAQEPVVVAAGRLTKAKNFPFLLRAFHLLTARIPSAKLIILGDGELRAPLQALVSHLQLDDKVDLPGFVKNPWSFMARASVFALSSDFEGMGLVLVEALACGVPVVSTDCASGPSEVLEAGRLGALVPAGDTSEFASALAAAIENPQTPPSLAPLAAKYDPRRIAALFVEAVERVGHPST